MIGPAAALGIPTLWPPAILRLLCLRRWLWRRRLWLGLPVPSLALTALSIPPLPVTAALPVPAVAPLRPIDGITVIGMRRGCRCDQGHEG